MILTYATVLFSINTLMRLDILAWVVGILVLTAAILLVWLQHRQYRLLKDDLAQLAKIKTHSVEYDLVLKTMKLAVWRLDIPTRSISFESDYRDQNDSLPLPPGSKLEDLAARMEPDNAAMLKKGYDDMLSGRADDYHLQYKVHLPHSDRFYWSEIYATVDKRDLLGHPLSLVGTAMRIDQQKDIEEALMDAVFHAEESDRLKSAFLANISHEIRTPLNAIVGFSEVLPQAADEEERQKLIGLIRKNNHHLLQLFDDVVNMSKLEARGGGELKLSTFPLVLLFEELVDEYRQKSMETGVALEIVRKELLPEIHTDRSRLHEILNQYLNNALKFTSQGKVTLGCDRLEDKWRIWVRDTGRGIPADKCNEQLFDRFFKVDEFVPGTGLGLSICRSQAMAMNAEVGVSSTLGEGSVFWIDLK
jgi:signal transduction histidine kinase